MQNQVELLQKSLDRISSKETFLVLLFYQLKWLAAGKGKHFRSVRPLHTDAVCSNRRSGVKKKNKKRERINFGSPIIIFLFCCFCFRMSKPPKSIT